MQRLEGPYHQSEINDYLACPQTLLLKLEGVEPLFRPVALVRGTAVHRTIHRLHTKGRWSRWQRVYEEEWAGAFDEPGPPVDSPPEKIEEEYQKWQTALASYVERERETEVLFSELRLRGTVTSRSGRLYPIEGTVDQIRPACSGKGYDLYELKTSAYPPRTRQSGAQRPAVPLRLVLRHGRGRG